MNVQRVAWQVENLLQKLGLMFESTIAETGSRYFFVSPNCDDSFSIRISDHGQVYGNPRFCIDMTDDGDSYKLVKAVLVDLAKREKDWNIANGNI